jgi:uncharacterized membrane protein YdjX (TVP38/TMEM64 family)
VAGERRRAARRVVLRALALLALVAVLVTAGRKVGAYVPQFAAWVTGVGAWGPIAFIAGYVVASIAFIPGSVLTLAAGAIFGVARGTAIVFVGAVLGSSAAFLIARYAARGAIERKVAGDPRFAAVDRAIAREGRRIVLLLRLSPVFPFNVLNYGLGLTRVRYLDYLIASVGMLPGTLLYVYTGKVAGDVAAAAAGASPARGAGYWIVLGLGLAATVAVTALVTRTARRALAEVTDDARPEA